MTQKLSDYDFELPPELIAQTPADNRENSRLLFLNQGKIGHYSFSDLPSLLRAGDLLVRNTTKVIPARIKCTRSGGGKSEVLLVREMESCVWECLARPTSSLKEGKKIFFANELMTGVIRERLGGGRVIVEFLPADNLDFWEVVERIGELPLPPYIAREDGPTEDDSKRYQTVFASQPGAVAAPTAGLHFTKKIFAELKDKGVDVCDVVLHVGPGTFRPVKVENITEHIMDYEYFSICKKTAEMVNNAKKKDGGLFQLVPPAQGH